MITITYLYRKKAGEWFSYQQEFDDCIKASKFCWKMKDNPSMILLGYSAIYPCDAEYLDMKVNMFVINRGKYGFNE